MMKRRRNPQSLEKRELAYLAERARRVDQAITRAVDDVPNFVAAVEDHVVTLTAAEDRDDELHVLRDVLRDVVERYRSLAGAMGGPLTLPEASEREDAVRAFRELENAAINFAFMVGQAIEEEYRANPDLPRRPELEDRLELSPYPEPLLRAELEWATHAIQLPNVDRSPEEHFDAVLDMKSRTLTVHGDPEPIRLKNEDHAKLLLVLVQHKGGWVRPADFKGDEEDGNPEVRKSLVRQHERYPDAKKSLVRQHERFQDLIQAKRGTGCRWTGGRVKVVNG